MEIFMNYKKDLKFWRDVIIGNAKNFLFYFT